MKLCIQYSEKIWSIRKFFSPPDFYPSRLGVAVETHVVTCASIVQSSAVYALLGKTMSICEYFKPTVSLPYPNGPLKEKIWSSTIRDVNKKVCPEVERGLKKPGCRGFREPYVKLTPEQTAVIGRRAAEHDVTAAIRYFSK